MRQMAAGLLQIFVINLLHGKILMRFANGEMLIRIVENRGAFRLEVDCRLDGRALYRLTAAVDASAGAGHDFNKIDLSARRTLPCSRSSRAFFVPEATATRTSVSPSL